MVPIPQAMPVDKRFGSGERPGLLGIGSHGLFLEGLTPGWAEPGGAELWQGRVAPRGPESPGCAAQPSPGQGWLRRNRAERQRLVETRLASLMAVLGGEQGPDRPAVAAQAQAGTRRRADTGLPGRAGGVHPPDQGTGRAVLGRLLDCICPDGSPVLHGLVLPGRSQPLEHLVVAPRGLVVVCPVLLSPVGPMREQEAHGPLQRTQCGPRPASPRSDAVRATLRRANALRHWLEETATTGASQLAGGGPAVLAAVCTQPVPAGPVPVVIDDLWLGSLERLPAWLATGAGGKPGGRDREAIARALAAQLGLAGQRRP